MDIGLRHEGKATLGTKPAYSLANGDGRHCFYKRNGQMKQSRKLALTAVSACVMTLGSLSTTTASAEAIQLGFILDSSGSITSGGWTSIRTGLANAVNALIPTSGPDTYYLSVVSFSTNAVVNIANQAVTSASKAGLVSTIQNLNFAGNNTNFEAAFKGMQTALTTPVTGNPTYSATYVNFATDGQPNTCGTPGASCNLTTADAAGIAARNAMVTAAGVDNISIEGIGSGVNVSLLKTGYCKPQPCDDTVPFNFPDQGFYTAVATTDQWAAAIDYKIRVITKQVPEPTSLALVGLALLGLGAARRRVTKT